MFLVAHHLRNRFDSKLEASTCCYNKLLFGDLFYSYGLSRSLFVSSSSCQLYPPVFCLPTLPSYHLVIVGSIAIISKPNFKTYCTHVKN